MESSPVRSSDLAQPPTDGESGEGPIIDPAELLRVGTIVQSLMSNLQHVALDEAGRERLANGHRKVVELISESVSKDLGVELNQLVAPLAAQVPTESELRVAQAQLAGWLEGLFRGLQMMAMAQMAGQRAGLPSGAPSLDGLSSSPAGQGTGYL